MECLNKRLIKYIIFSFVVALLIEFFCQFDGVKVIGAIKNHYERSCFGIMDMSYRNIEISGKKRIICGDDPQIYINEINGHVSDVEIKLKELSSSVIPIQIFYSYDGVTFTEEQSVFTNYTENYNAIFVTVGQDVVSLRLDIGTTSEDAYGLDQIIVNPSGLDYICAVFSKMSFIRCLFYFIGIFALLMAIYDFNRFKNFLFQYRWQIGIAAIVVCTLCRVHGSSIGMIAEWISGYDTSRLWGTARAIRSDEYVVFTEMALAQVKSGFSWFSDIWGFSKRDMFMTYGQPILNIVTLYRPFAVGYILFGAEYGLALYWSSRFVILVLVSFEFARLFTNDERKLSLVFACLVGLSPIVQWWYSVGGLVEMLIFGQLAVILLYQYIRCKSRYIKATCMAGIILCSGGYIMTLYPPWMIPLFFVFLACGISILLDNRSHIKICLEDLLICGTGVTILALSMIYIFKTSESTIFATTNTIYPGTRKYYGGPFGNIIELFRGWSSYLWTFIDIGNPCEEVDFISFFPIGIVLSLIILFKQKKKDTWLIVLNIFNILLIIYFLFETPEIVGTLTLMSHASPRLVNAIGLINLIILCRSMCIIKWNKTLSQIIVPLSIVFSICGYYGVLDFLTPALKWIIILVTALFAFLLTNYGDNYVQNIFVVYVIAISMIGGALVNPIDSGLDSVYRLKPLQAVERINVKESGTWAVNSEDIAFANLPTIVGAKCMNAVATYPDYDLWESLGLQNNQEVWNRYAHTSVIISDNVSVEQIFVDHINLYVTVQKLKEIDVKYILSDSDLSQFSGIKCLWHDGSFSIWEIE